MVLKDLFTSFQRFKRLVVYCMTRVNVAVSTIPVISRPSRPYHLITLSWDTHRGINEAGVGTLATRRQLQAAIEQIPHASQGTLAFGLAPGAVVQLADGLYWLSQDWQVLCL